MTNLVQITVKANDTSAWSDISKKATAAGMQAADAFNRAFKLRADASIGATERLKESGGLGGKDTELMNKLRSYGNTPGGIGILGTGNDTSLMSMLKNQIRSMGSSGGPGLLSTGAGGTSSTDLIRQVMQGAGPSNVTTKDLIQQVLTGNTPGNVTTKDLIDQVLEGTGASNVTTKDFIDQIIQGNTPGNINTKDIIHPTVDDADIAALGKSDGKTYGEGFKSSDIEPHIDDSKLSDEGSSDGETYGKSFASKLKDVLSSSLGSGSGGGMSAIGDLLKGGSGGDSGGGGVSSALNAGGVAGGALPGMAGVSGMTATVTGLAGALVAVLPAITAVAGGLASIGGGFAILEETNTKFAADMSGTLSKLEGVFGAAAAPLAEPLEKAATQIVGYFKAIEPDLKEVFGDSAQLIQPLVKGFESLMSGAGPGFLAMIKAAGPVFTTVGQAFGDLGKSLGEMFKDFASDGAGSATILKSFLDIINSLLPFIGSLGKIMVSSLAPAFAAFSGALDQVLPALNPVVKIIGDFAGAVLSDLGSVLGAIGTLLVKLAPSFTALAKAASGVFSALENSGVFASLGNALENLAAPLGNLINALVKALLPALPGIIAAFDEFSKIFTGAVVTAVSGVADALTDIVKAVPVPVITALADAFVAVKVAMLAWNVVNGLVTGSMKLLGLVTEESAAQIEGMTLVEKLQAIWEGVVQVATEAWSVAQAALNAILDMNPFVAIGVAVVALAALIIKYHTQIWDEIVKVWGDVESFCKQVWQGIEDDAQGAWNLVYDYIVNPLEKAYEWVVGKLDDLREGMVLDWDTIKSDATDAWNLVYDDIINPIEKAYDWVTSKLGDLRNWMSSKWSDIKSDATNDWNDLENIFEKPVNFLIGTVYDKGIARIWNDTVAKLGGPSIPQVATLASGGLLAGFGGGDIIPALLEPGETVVSKEQSKLLASVFRAAGVPGYSGGGIIGDITGWVTSTLGKIADGGKLGAAIASGNQTAFANALMGMLGATGTGGAEAAMVSVMGSAPGKIVTGAVSAVWDSLVKAVQGSASAAASTAPYTGGYGPGVTQWTSDVLEVLKMLGQPSSDLSVVLRQMMTESGGNPNAINLTDSNAAAGDPSRGLMQTIMTTFEAYRDPSLPNDIYNPLANIYAGLNYAIHRYGSGWTSVLGQGHGYDQGGWLPTGRSIAINNTGAPEYVVGPGGLNVTLELASSGNADFDSFMSTWIKKYVRLKGGKGSGATDRAFTQN
jgi:hypothetical protein